MKLFGMGDNDYKRFLNFLAAHDCSVDARLYRRGGPVEPLAASIPPAVIPPATIESPRRCDGVPADGTGA